MLPLFISAIENDDDRQFVADIYTRYQPALYRKAQKVLHDNDRAEEAVHEAMLRVIRYLDRVREIPCAPWRTLPNPHERLHAAGYRYQSRQTRPSSYRGCWLR